MVKTRAEIQRQKYLKKLNALGKTPVRNSKYSRFITDWELEKVYNSAIKKLAIKLIRNGYTLDDLIELLQY